MQCWKLLKLLKIKTIKQPRTSARLIIKRLGNNQRLNTIILARRIITIRIKLTLITQCLSKLKLIQYILIRLFKLIRTT